jgi:hypothetical protein
MAGNTLENLDWPLSSAQLPVKCGMCGSRKMLDGFPLRFQPLFKLSVVVNGVQEVAGSNPVAPTIFPQKPFGYQAEGLFCFDSRSFLYVEKRSTSLGFQRCFFR